MIDKKLFIYTVLLITVGIFFTYSLSTYVVLLFGYDDYHFLLRQSIFALVSITTMWALAQLNPDIWLKRVGMSLFLGSMFLMILMPFMPTSLVSEIGGAKRWIKLFGFSLAPVEFFKIGFIYFLAWSFSRKLGHHGNMGLKNEFIRFSPYAIVMLLVMFLIAFMQKDLGQVVVLSVTLLFLLMFAGSSFRFFLTLILAAFSFGIIAIITTPHRIRRIESWWASAQDFVLSIFPESIAKYLRVTNFEEPYQIGHSLNAINNGGFFGAGIGNGTFKLGFLSEVHTDFILAGIAEEVGFLGVMFITFIFIMMLQRIFKVANRTQNEIVHLFSVGMALLIASAFFLNAYGISGMTPIKGISVPFLSYGGSSMLASSIGIGMILMASKKVDLQRRT